MKLFLRSNTIVNSTDNDVSGTMLPGDGTKNNPANITRVAVFKPDGRILVKYMNDDTVDLPGGHLEKNESLAEAARREIEEEIGVELITVPTQIGIDTPTVYFRKEYCRVWLFGGIVDSNVFLPELPLENHCDSVEFIHVMKLRKLVRSNTARKKTSVVFTQLFDFWKNQFKST